MTRPNWTSGVMDTQAGDEIPTWGPMQELGITGLRRVGGYVDDEFLPQLRGRKAVQVYREMADNSAIVAAYLTTLRWLLAQLEWRVEPASSDQEDRDNAERVEQNMHDMEHGWGDMIGEMVSAATYGWSLHELVYKRREGLWAKNPKNRSKYDDGQIGWRKIPIRSQETLLRWIFTDEGDAEAMVQMAPPNYATRVLPMGKCLLVRPLLNKNNPEGYSLLRPMWRSWFMIKRLEEIEATGAERDLVGMPMATMPSSYLAAKPGTAAAKMRDAITRLVTSVRRNEQEGIIFPSETDPDSKTPMFEFSLLSSGGTRQFDLDTVIQRYETRMLMTAMADFIMTGHEDSGASYALHTDKSGIFRTGLNALAQNIAQQFNRHAIPQLFKLNNLTPKELPKIVPNDVDPPDLNQLATFMTALAGAGVQWFPDAELEQFLRDAARLPKLDKTVAEIREVEQRQTAIMGLAQLRLAELQTQQQAEMGEQQMAQGAMATTGAALQLGQQANQIANPPADPGIPVNPGDPDGAQAKDQAGQSTAQARIATERSKVGLQSDREKLNQLKRRPIPGRPPAGRSPAKRTAVKKSNPFLQEVQ